MLDEHQRDAVASRARRLYVEAGPGSGKTRVLVARVARLLREGEVGEDILVVTFTHAAAAEVRERVARDFAGDAPEGSRRWQEARARVRNLRCTTLHGLALALLKRQNPGEAVRVLDQVEHDALIAYAGIEVGKITADRASRAACEGLPRRSRDRLLRSEAVRRREAHYLRRLSARSYAELEGLLGEMAARGETPPWRHVLVDEVQDLTADQLAVAVSLASAGTLTLVGDPRQCIFQWRGADPAKLREVIDAQGFETVTLPINYRSRPEVVAVLEDPDLVAAREPGGSARSLDLSLSQVAVWLTTTPYDGSTVVLGRTWRELEQLRDLIAQHGGAAALTRGVPSVWRTPAARWLLACFGWVLDPTDPVAAWRAFNGLAIRCSTDYFAERCRQGPGAWRDLPVAGVLVDLDADQVPARASLAPLRDHVGADHHEDLSAVLDAIEAWSAEHPDEGLVDLLGWISTQRDDRAAVPEGAIALSTVHGAKGLEWDRVVVLPLRDTAPELRFVAASRAREALVELVEPDAIEDRTWR